MLESIAHRMAEAIGLRIELDVWAVGATPGPCRLPWCSRRKPLHRRHNRARYQRRCVRP